MAFDKEPVGYEKTVLSDLQGAWQNLRDTVVEHAGFTDRERTFTPRAARQSPVLESVVRRLPCIPQ